MRRSNVLTYLHSDHLGGTAAVTMSTGAYSAHQGYWAYGASRTGGSLPTDHKFTGQKLDSRSGLMYYNARYYDPALGMFVSPDTIVPDAGQVVHYNCCASNQTQPTANPTTEKVSYPRHVMVH